MSEKNIEPSETNLIVHGIASVEVARFDDTTLTHIRLGIPIISMLWFVRKHHESLIRLQPIPFSNIALSG